MSEPDIFTCSECGANLIEAGITEVLFNCIAETKITFTKGDFKKSSADVYEPDNEWVLCGACGAELRGRTSEKIIDAFESQRRERCESQ